MELGSMHSSSFWFLRKSYGVEVNDYEEEAKIHKQCRGDWWEDDFQDPEEEVKIDKRVEGHLKHQRE